MRHDMVSNAHPLIPAIDTFAVELIACHCVPLDHYNQLLEHFFSAEPKILIHAILERAFKSHRISFPGLHSSIRPASSILPALVDNVLLASNILNVLNGESPKRGNRLMIIP